MSDYLLNLTSVTPPYAEEAVARDQLSMLLSALASLDDESGPLPNFRVDRDPWLIPFISNALGREISLGEFAQTFYGTQDHDLAAYFDSLNRTIPSDSGLDAAMIEAILRLSPKSTAQGFEGTLESIHACELEAGLCSLCGFIMVSLLRDQRWAHNQMAFVVDGSVYSFDHVASPKHAEELRLRRLAETRLRIKPSSFWTFKDIGYPHLKCGRDVEAQVDKVNTSIFPLILRRLAELDTRASQWQLSPSLHFPEGATQITGETFKTMKRYGTERRFRGSDGIQHTYEEHVWIDTGNRIHLIREPSTRSVEIGYIGRHLPTMDYPT